MKLLFLLLISATCFAQEKKQDSVTVKMPIAAAAFMITTLENSHGDYYLTKLLLDLLYTQIQEQTKKTEKK